MLKELIALKNYSNIKIGGPARYFLEIPNDDELVNELKLWRKNNPNVKIFIMGEGTNVLFDDRGFDGLVVLIKIKTIKKLKDNLVEVSSGLTMAELLKYSVAQSLSGLEWAGGLPGTLGGAIFGNAGAFGKETKDNIVIVKSLSLADFSLKERRVDECAFAYRTSLFKRELSQKEVILSALIKLTIAKQAGIKAKIDEKIAYRKERQPLEFPNLGSTFKNIALDKVPKEFQEQFKDKVKDDPFPLIPAAVFLSEAGLKGKRIGGAQISEKHPNFIINLGNAKSTDVKELIKIARQKVFEKFNLELELEIIQLNY